MLCGFDGDREEEDSSVKRNTKDLLELLGYAGTFPPPTIIESKFTVFEKNFEEQMKSEIPNYATLKTSAKSELGLTEDSKPLIARYVARKIITNGSGTSADHIPATIKQIIEKVNGLAWTGTLLKTI